MGTVLIVEDHPQTLRRWLRRAPRVFDVTTASTVDEAKEALEALDSGRLLGGLFDVRLHGQSSLPILERMRSEAPRAVAMVCTGYLDVYGVEIQRLGAIAIDKRNCRLDQLLREFFRRSAAAAGHGELRIGDAIGLASLCCGWSPELTSVIAVLARGAARKDVGTKLGVPEKTIEHWLRGNKAADLVQLVLRVAHEGAAALMESDISDSTGVRAAPSHDRELSTPALPDHN